MKKIEPIDTSWRPPRIGDREIITGDEDRLNKVEHKLNELIEVVNKLSHPTSKKEKK